MAEEPRLTKEEEERTRDVFDDQTNERTYLLCMQQLKSVAVKAQKARITLARADKVSSMTARAMVILFVYNWMIRITMLWFHDDGDGEARRCCDER